MKPDFFLTELENIRKITDLDMLINRIAQKAKELTSSEASSVALLDSDGKHLYFKVVTGEKGALIQKYKIKIGQGIMGYVAEEKKPIIVNDVRTNSKFDPSFDKATGFVTRNILCVPILSGENELIGVVEVLNKKDNKDYTPDDLQIFDSYIKIAAIVVENLRNKRLMSNLFTNVFEIIVQAAESRKSCLIGHSRNISTKSICIAKSFNADPREWWDLYYASLLHDIGFLAGGEESFKEKMHPEIGAEMIKNIDLLVNIGPIIRCHHENLDGSGFPYGLKGEEIPLWARLISLLEYIEENVASGRTIEEVENEIKREADKKFQADFVEAYFKMKEEIYSF